MAVTTLTAARLRELLNYDPLTGVFTRIVPVGYRGCHKAGTVAGSQHSTGYVYLNVDGQKYRAHRLAWLYVHGEFPPHGLDHKDGIGLHNWIDNLRPATQAENVQNQRRARRDNTSGLLGVERCTKGRRWTARIEVNGKRTYIGIYRTPEEAHAAYLAVKVVMHPYQTLVS